MQPGAAVVAGGRTPFRSSGGAGWVVLAGVVVAWDLAAPETLSSAFRRACATPGGKVAVGLLWVNLTAHLFGVVPEKYDLIYLGIKAARYRKITSESAAV